MKCLDSKFFHLTCILILVAAFSQFIKIKGHKENDHLVYYRTALRLNQNDYKNIYTLKDGAFPFQYAPSTLFIFKPLSYFSETQSRKIWIIVQSIFFFAGLIILSWILKILGSANSWKVLFFSTLILYRYYLDSLFCGQISGLMFFIFTCSLYFHLKNKYFGSIMFVFWNSLFKILPAVYLLAYIDDMKSFRRFTKILLIVIFISSLPVLIILFRDPYLGNYFSLLHKEWLKIILENQQYFDGSTIKNQSLRGFLLRLIGQKPMTDYIWKFSLFILTVKILIIKSYGHFESAKNKIIFFIITILFFEIVMPENLPYQMLNMLIPVAFMIQELISNRGKLNAYFLISFCLFNSLSSVDLVGHYISNAVQLYSIPLFLNIILLFYFSKRILSSPSLALEKLNLEK
jgi:hypothetical protein